MLKEQFEQFRVEKLFNQYYTNFFQKILLGMFRAPTLFPDDCVLREQIKWGFKKKTSEVMQVNNNNIKGVYQRVAFKERKKKWKAKIIKRRNSDVKGKKERKKGEKQILFFSLFVRSIFPTSNIPLLKVIQ